MKRLLRVLVIAQCMISLAACEMGGSISKSTNQKEGEEPNFEMASELFEDVGTENGKQVTRFKTNDARYWSQLGYTLWTAWGIDNFVDFSERTVEVSKPKGYSGAGYGMVICQGTREVNGKAVQTMLTVMINNNGQYAIGKAIGGRYEDILWWTASPYINNIGAGSPTTIRVVGHGAGLFSLYINGNYIRDFIDTTEPIHSGGRNGYIVVIAPADIFPQGEVDVYFSEQR